MLRSSPALPPIIPVLRSLLASLGFDPASLPHLRSLSPALLLKLLSVILGQPLPLPVLSPTSSCSILDDDVREELETVKLIVGVLSMSAGLDMSSLEPRRTVERHTAELLVLARATVLLAVEHGWDGTSAEWHGKVLRRSTKRRPARSQADCARSFASVSFTTPPPTDLPLPIEPVFSLVRHSTTPPSKKFRPLVAPLSPAPPPAVSELPLPADDASALIDASLKMETDPITRLTAPDVWRKRVDEERSALRDCLESLDR